MHMIELDLDITTADGAMNTYVVHPEEGPPCPVILFFMDAPGMREELRRMVRRLATAGYFVIAPNLYYRQTRAFNVFETGDRDRMFDLMNTLTNGLVDEDARAMVAWATAQEAADTNHIGTVGYCMSGPFALTAVAALGEDAKAAASIHGVRLWDEADDSPHRCLGQTGAEVYVACAETDSYAPPEMIAKFETALEASAASGRVEWFPGTEHGFAFEERPQYIQSASDRHWERLHDLFHRNLR